MAKISVGESRLQRSWRVRRLGALAIIESDERIDLLFTDMFMPGMSGVELALRAREVRPDLRILFTSGDPENAALKKERLGDDVRLLPKPYRKRQLAQKLRRVLGTDMHAA